MVRTMIAQFEEHDRKIFWVLLALMGLAIFAYIYFLGSSVYSVIERRTAENSTTKLSAKISILESQYSELDKKINLDLAYEQGFVDVGVPRYLSSRESVPSFTLRTANERVR